MQETAIIRISRYILNTLVTILGIFIVTFFLTRSLPDNPRVEIDIPVSRDAAVVERLSTQFWRYTAPFLQGDPAPSVGPDTPVLPALVRHLPASLELLLSGFLLAVITALPLGGLAALWSGSWLDRSCRWMARGVVALPTFLAGLLLSALFHHDMDWALPPHMTGFLVVDSYIAGDFEMLADTLKQLALPAVTLGLVAMAPLVRMTRDAMVQVLGSAFIRMAQAHGLSRRHVWWAGILRNAMLPVGAALGSVCSLLLGATILVETVFAWPGMGAYAVAALATSDAAVVQGMVLIMAVLGVLLRLGSDLFSMWMDPRVRTDASST